MLDKVTMFGSLASTRSLDPFMRGCLVSITVGGKLCTKSCSVKVLLMFVLNLEEDMPSLVNDRGLM